MEHQSGSSTRLRPRLRHRVIGWLNRYLPMTILQRLKLTGMEATRRHQKDIERIQSIHLTRLPTHPKGRCSIFGPSLIITAKARSQKRSLAEANITDHRTRIEFWKRSTGSALLCSWTDCTLPSLQAGFSFMRFVFLLLTMSNSILFLV